MNPELATFVAGVAVGAAGVVVPVLMHVHGLKDRLTERISQLENGRVRDLEDAVRELQPVLDSMEGQSKRSSPKHFRAAKRAPGGRT